MNVDVKLQQKTRNLNKIKKAEKAKKDENEM